VQEKCKDVVKKTLNKFDWSKTLSEKIESQKTIVQPIDESSLLELITAELIECGFTKIVKESFLGGYCFCLKALKN
jgi:hypothetical protein